MVKLFVYLKSSFVTPVKYKLSEKDRQKQMTTFSPGALGPIYIHAKNATFSFEVSGLFPF